MKKFLFGILLCFSMIASVCMLDAHASDSRFPNWTRVGKSWRLVYRDGSIYNYGWFYDIDTGIWYYINSDGYALTQTTTPDGHLVSASGRLINPAELWNRIYPNTNVSEYQNLAFRFKLMLPNNLPKEVFGAQNANEVGDANIDGGVKVTFYNAYKMEVFGDTFSSGVPNHQQVEDFVTYSGMKGKLYLEKVKDRYYINAQVGGPEGMINAYVEDGIPVNDYPNAKESMMKLLRGINGMR